MSKFFTKLTVATLGLALTVGVSSVAQSCPRGGGGGGYYGGYSAPRCNYNYNYRPVQPRPVQIAPQQQVQFSQQQQIQPQQQVQPQQPLQALGGQQVQAGGQVQQAGGQQFAGQQAGGQPAGNQQAQQVQFTSQQQQQGSATTARRVAQQPANNAPAQLSAQQTALQALSAFGLEDAEASNSITPDAQPEAAFHVGSWTAVLGNNVSVQLVLQADGAFSWTASANGKTSSFEGTYNLDGGSLQLSRSSDNQQLSGSFTRTNSGGFNFKLQGKNDAGLNFARN